VVLEEPGQVGAFDPGSRRFACYFRNHARKLATAGYSLTAKA
jgi:hypothetical protein